MLSASDVVGTASVEVPLVSIRIVVSISVGPLVVVIASVVEDEVVMTASKVVGTVASISIGPVVVITSAVEVSTDDIVVTSFDVVVSASVDVPVVSIRVVVSPSLG